MLSLLLLVSFIGGAAASELDFALINGCNANDSNSCGVGACNATTLTCSCPEWWTTSTDFISSQADCATSVVAIYILWSLNLAEIAWVLYTTMYVIVVRMEIFWETRKKTPSATLWKNKGLLGLIFFALVCLPSQVIMAIYRLVYPTSAIAFDLFPTILLLTGKIGLYGTSMAVQGPLIAAVLKGNAETKRLVSINYAMNFMASFASIAVGVFPFITYGAYQNNVAKQLEIMRAYYYVHAAFLLLNGLQAYAIKRFIFRALDRASNTLQGATNKTTGIKKKISEFQGSIINQGALQSVLYILMGAIPFLVNKHAYFLPISWLAMPILWKRLAFQFDLDRGNTKPIRARLGLAKETGSAKSSTPHDDNWTSREPQTKRLFPRHHRVKNTATNTQQEKSDSAFSNGFLSSPNMGSFEEKFPVVTLALPEEEEQGKLVVSRKQTRNGESNATALTRKTFLEGDTRIEDVVAEGSELRQDFEDFLKRKMAHEYLDLYDDCVAFERETDDAKLNAMGHNIVLKYVLDNGSQSIDMDFTLRKQVLEIDRKRAFTPTSLVDVQKLAITLLQTNFYAQFLRYVENEYEEEE